MQANSVYAFEGVFSRTSSPFEIDLSNSTLIGLMQAHQAHVRKSSPRYTNTAVVTQLRTIEKVYKTEIMPINVTDIFYKAFIDMLLMEGCQLSTAKEYCGKIRTALEWGTKHNCKVSSTYDEFSVDVPDPCRVVLTADEVSHIAHFDCSTIPCRKDHQKTLEKVRDQFIYQINIFQRHSDAVLADESNFDHGFYKCVQQKTGNKASVDINRYSVTPEHFYTLLEKYNYQPPYPNGINAFNKYLHELLRYIGGSFDEEIVVEQRIKGEIVKKTYKKWQKISSHCARRTAITLAIRNAKTEAEIRHCSGHHNKSDSFQCYVVYKD